MLGPGRQRLPKASEFKIKLFWSKAVLMASYLKTVLLVLQAFGTDWPSGAAVSSSPLSTCAKPVQRFSWRSLSGKRAFCSLLQPSRCSGDLHSQPPEWASPELVLGEGRQTGSSPCWWKVTLPFPSPIPQGNRYINRSKSMKSQSDDSFQVTLVSQREEHESPQKKPKSCHC